MLKSHYCGELRKEHVGKKISLAGWVDRRRDHGELVFIDLRDRSGIAQVVFNPEVSRECHRIAEQARNEYVLHVKGEVSLRPKGTENPKLPSGEIEVIAGEVEILNVSKTPPFYINEETEVDEAVRLKYRYLDLRRQKLAGNIMLRSQIISDIRKQMTEMGFQEFQTPILTSSSPEGARDYLVPSRLHPGKFYALPQAPQQFAPHPVRV